MLTIAIAAPGVSGVIARTEARLQGRRGPRVLQPYFDLAKLFRKEALAPEGASWVFLAAPLAAFTCYLTVPLLIPVLTSYPLPLGYMGDILGGGFILSLASFLVAVAALETGSPYAQLGASRAKTFGAITEPVVLFVVFTVALLTGTDLPYALAATVRSSAGQIIRPAHVLAAAALFMVILYETSRIPVETHTGTNEFGMIEEARPFEHSGPYFALLKWGSAAKQLILYTILINVFVAPWGLAATQQAWAVLVAMVALPAKACVLGGGGRGHRQLVRQAAAVQDHRVRGGGVPARRARRVHALPRGWLMDPGQRARRLRRRRERHRGADPAGRVRHVPAGAAARSGPPVRGAVRADLGARRHRGRRPPPARAVRARRAGRRAQGGGDPAGAPAAAERNRPGRRPGRRAAATRHGRHRGQRGARAGQHRAARDHRRRVRVLRRGRAAGQRQRGAGRQRCRSRYRWCWSPSSS